PLTNLLFFNPTAPTAISPLSLHDALPILSLARQRPRIAQRDRAVGRVGTRAHVGRGRLVAVVDRFDGLGFGAGRAALPAAQIGRSEEHTSELQLPCNLVCRLLLEKKKNIK